MFSTVGPFNILNICRVAAGSWCNQLFASVSLQFLLESHLCPTLQFFHLYNILYMQEKVLKIPPETLNFWNTKQLAGTSLHFSLKTQISPTVQGIFCTSICTSMNRRKSRILLLKHLIICISDFERLD